MYSYDANNILNRIFALKIVALRIVAYQHTVQILRRFQTINKYLLPFTFSGSF